VRPAGEIASSEGEAYSVDRGRTWETDWIMDFLIELRQYTLHPGQRDVLIDLFEREFIETQEALGMKVIGTFRDLERPERFVWIRGFADMASRAAALNEFYSGPVWAEHRNAANATMIDSDNVLLLRAARAGSGFSSGNRPRPPRGATAIPEGLVIVNIYPFAAAVGPQFLDFFTSAIEPELRAAGVTVSASYRTETTPNDFPRLPVREKDHVFVWFAEFENPSRYDRSLAKLARSPAWQAIDESLRRQLDGPPEVLRLQPTARSELRP
jgi:hypothetical protein